MVTYFLGREEVSAYLRDFLSRLQRFDPLPILWCPLTRSGNALLSQLLDLVQERYPDLAGTVSVLPIEVGDGSGTIRFLEGDPAKDIPARCEAVRRLPRSSKAQPIHVMVRGGKYFLAETLVLDARDSGARNAPVTWSAYAGERPIFSGGAKVVHWNRFEKKIQQAELAQIGRDAKPRDLFFNGVRQFRARTPNLDPVHPLYGGWAFMEGSAGPDAFKYAEGLFKRPLLKPALAEVRYFVGPNGGWGNQVLPITSIDYDQRIIHMIGTRRSPTRGSWACPRTITG
jgi:hypothetical protein